VRADFVAEHAAEYDDAVLDEAVHEGRVLRPTGLLLERLRMVVLGPGAPQDDEEHHRGGSILSGRLNAR
jgi:hypothetical protein